LPDAPIRARIRPSWIGSTCSSRPASRHPKF
jgi:hypothetical protein